MYWFSVLLFISYDSSIIIFTKYDMCVCVFLRARSIAGYEIDAFVVQVKNDVFDDNTQRKPSSFHAAFFLLLRKLLFVPDTFVRCFAV